MINLDKIVKKGLVVKLRHGITTQAYKLVDGKYKLASTPRHPGTSVTIVDQFSNDVFSTMFSDGQYALMVRPHLIFPEEEKSDILKAAIDFYAEDTFTK